MGKRALLTERVPHSVSLAENLHQIWTITARTGSREKCRLRKPRTAGTILQVVHPY